MIFLSAVSATVAAAAIGAAIGVGTSPPLLLAAAAGFAGLTAILLTRARNGAPKLTPLSFLFLAQAISVLILLPPIGGATGRRPQLEIFGLVNAITLGLAWVMAAPRSEVLAFPRKSARSLDLGMTAFASLALLGAVSGFVSRAPGNYLLGDTYALVAVPATYFLAKRTLRNEQHGLLNQTSCIKILGIALLLQQGRDALAAIELVGAGQLTRIHSVMWIHNLVGVLVLFCLALSSRAAKRFYYAAAAVAVLAVGTASGFRTYIAILVVVALLVLLLRPRLTLSRGIPVAAAGVLLGASILAILFLAGREQLVLRPLTHTLSQAELFSSDRRLDPSTIQRGIESQAVKRKLNETPAAWITGFGSGATYQLPFASTESARALYRANDFTAHHIHNSFWSFTYRYGLIGLTIYAFLLMSVTIAAIRALRLGGTPLDWAAPLGCLAFIVTAPFFTIIPRDLLFGALSGMVAVQLQRADRTRLSKLASERTVLKAHVS